MIKGKNFEFYPMKPTQKGVGTNIYYNVHLEGISVGYILLENYDFKLERAEVAYLVYKPFRSKGIATHMLKEFIEEVPNYFNVSYFDAKVRSDNIASCMVLEKAGFKEKSSSSLVEDRRYFFYDTEEEKLEEQNAILIEKINNIISAKEW